MIQEWNYAHDADLTIGETHVSKTAKIILICLITALVILTGLAIYFRAYIYDYIVNPSVELTSKSINLEVHDKFDPDKYIANANSGYTYTIINGDIDTNTLNSYTVTYESKNKIRTNSIDLKVNVVDTTGPVIELVDNVANNDDILNLTKGKETENFNATSYLKSVTDNYCNKDDIKIEFTTDIDWSKNPVQIIYSAKDTKGNETTKVMNIVVLEDKEQIIDEYKQQLAEEEAKRQKEEEKRRKEEEKVAQNNSDNNNSNKSSNNNSSNKSSNSSNKSSGSSSKSSDPYISGVHDVSVKVGASPQDIYAKLIKGVSGSGTVSVDASNVNPTVAGKYTATFTSSDGVTKKCTVTVKE